MLQFPSSFEDAVGGLFLVGVSHCCKVLLLSVSHHPFWVKEGIVLMLVPVKPFTFLPIPWPQSMGYYGLV